MRQEGRQKRLILTLTVNMLCNASYVRLATWRVTLCQPDLHYNIVQTQWVWEATFIPSEPLAIKTNYNRNSNNINTLNFFNMGNFTPADHLYRNKNSSLLLSISEMKGKSMFPTHKCENILYSTAAIISGGSYANQMSLNCQAPLMGCLPALWGRPDQQHE